MNDLKKIDIIFSIINAFYDPSILIIELGKLPSWICSSDMRNSNILKISVQKLCQFTNHIWQKIYENIKKTQNTKFQPKNLP